MALGSPLPGPRLRPDRRAGVAGLLLALALHGALLTTLARPSARPLGAGGRSATRTVQAWLWLSEASNRNPVAPPTKVAAIAVRLRAAPDLLPPDWGHLRALAGGAEDTEVPAPSGASGPALAPSPPDARLLAAVPDTARTSPLAAATLFAARQRDARLQRLRQDRMALGSELAALGLDPASCPLVDGGPRCPADHPPLPEAVLARLHSQQREAQALGLDERALPPLY